MEESQPSLMSQEFKVGLMVVFAGIALMVAILFVNNFHFAASGYKARVNFRFLGDLKSNAPVEYAGGIKVGQVEDIHIINGQPEVDLRITEPHLQLRKDSQVCIYSAGLLGSRYVQISADLGKGAPLGPDDVLQGVDANNLDLTFSELGDVLESFEKMLGDPKAKESFLHSFENMNRMTDDLLVLTKESHAKIERMIDQLSRSSGDVTVIVASARKVSKNLEDLTKALNKQKITQSVTDLNNTLRIMSELSQDLHDGKGALGVLLKDQKVADDLKGLVEELKAHPWKILWKQ